MAQAAHAQAQASQPLVSLRLQASSSPPLSMASGRWMCFPPSSLRQHGSRTLAPSSPVPTTELQIDGVCPQEGAYGPANHACRSALVGDGHRPSGQSPAIPHFNTALSRSMIRQGGCGPKHRPLFVKPVAAFAQPKLFFPLRLDDIPVCEMDERPCAYAPAMYK